MNVWNNMELKIYTIVDSETMLFYKCRSGKVGWPSAGAAKNAFKLCTEARLEDQDRFVLCSATSESFYDE